MNDMSTIRKISGLSYQDWIGNLLSKEEKCNIKFWRLRDKLWGNIILHPWRKEGLNAKG